MCEQVPGESPRLLVVDDQLLCVKIIANILAEGYTIEHACSGPDALALLEKIPLPDLILLDVMMPGMDGLALCRALKGSPRTRGVPVLFITVGDDVDSEAEALSAGGVDFIHKPVAPAVLRARVALHLRLSQRERALRQANDQLRALDDLRQRYAAIVESSGEAILSVDPSGCIITWNRSAEHLLGYSAREALGLTWQVLVTKDYQEIEAHILNQVLQGHSVGEYEARRCRKDGESIDVSVTLSPIRDAIGAPAGASMIIRDIRERKANEAELKRYHRLLEAEVKSDSLTGIPNRRALMEQIQREWRRTTRYSAPLSLMMIDVDTFKAFNDRYGHLEGDACLRRVAHAIRDSLNRAGDFVARYGGEEFVVLLPGTRAGEAALIGERIRHAVLALDIPHRGAINPENRVSVSVGVADAHPWDETPSRAANGANDEPEAGLERLLKRADQALYCAKTQGRNQVCLYVEEQSELTSNATFMTVENSLDNALKQALENGELVYYYQPKISLLTGQVAGAEALLRWIKPDGRIIPPGVFIPRAEQTGFLHTIALSMFDRLVTDLAGLSDHHPELVISFNLTAQDFATRDLIEKIEWAIAESRILPGQLQAELTETTLIENSTSIRANVQALVDMGVNLAMDDFGTGYSTIDVLSQWPFSIVKIHQGLIGRMCDESKSIAIVRSCIHMAHQLGLKIIAEGIECAEVYEFLLKAGCTEAQGFWTGRPMPVEELMLLLRSDQQWAGSPVGLIHMAQVDHLQWRRAVIDYALARTFSIPDLAAKLRPDHLEMNHRECGLGQWYYGNGLIYRGLAPYEALEEAHRQVHACGRQILDAVEEGAESGAILEHLIPLTQLSSRLLGLLQELELAALLQRSGEIASDSNPVDPDTVG